MAMVVAMELVGVDMVDPQVAMVVDMETTVQHQVMVDMEKVNHLPLENNKTNPSQKVKERRNRRPKNLEKNNTIMGMVKLVVEAMDPMVMVDMVVDTVEVDMGVDMVVKVRVVDMVVKVVKARVVDMVVKVVKAKVDMVEIIEEEVEVKVVEVRIPDLNVIGPIKGKDRTITHSSMS